MSIERFIRFSDDSGAIHYGELPLSDTSAKIEGLSVPILSGDPYTGLTRSGKSATVKKVFPYIRSLHVS